MKYKVLWIEDGARSEVSSFAGAVFTSMKYDLEVVLDVSDAVRKILNAEYDAVIVDIRIVPGSASKWKNLYSQVGKDKDNARLGMHLLFSLLKPDQAAVELENIPSWILPKRFGVFTVEGKGEVKDELEELGVNFYLQKQTNLPHTALLDFIEKIINTSVGNHQKGGIE
ncbi:hypothetical protein ACFLRB_02270 [Acidobacteriota bacterium]